MIGIYKIENLVNHICYIGQSRNIEKRFRQHKNAIYDNDINHYPLYKAIKKYGLENFSFEILEECSIEELNIKEKYWIEKFNSFNNGYNQTIGGDFSLNFSKLTFEDVEQIKYRLINFNDNDSHVQIAKDYNVSLDTIQAINVGREWIDETLTYPLHQSKYNSLYSKKKYCVDCGKEICKTSTRCVDCENKRRKENNILPVNREELKDLIRNNSFVSIGKKYKVSDNAIRKWCDKYNLPRKSSEIKKISDVEWENI